MSNKQIPTCNIRVDVFDYTVIHANVSFLEVLHSSPLPKEKQKLGLLITKQQTIRFQWRTYFTVDLSVSQYILPSLYA